MIVVCKSCDTKYDIKDEVIPEQGAQLKCAKCEEMIFVTKNADSSKVEETAKEDVSSVTPEDSVETAFSDFDERPTILAPQGFTGEMDVVDEESDSSSKSGISPNFLSDNHNSGPSFDEVFDDFEKEVSNENNDLKTGLDTKTTQEKNTSIDDALDGFFDDLTSDSKKEEVKEEPKEEIKKETKEEFKIQPPSFDSEVEVELEVETEDVYLEEDTLVDETESINTDDEETINISEEETVEISTVEMDELKEKLKDGLNDSDFAETSDSDALLKPSSKIYVKLEDGPVFEFQLEKDMIQWLKAKNSLSGILFSLDNTDFSPILNHQIFQDVQEIIKKQKMEVDGDVISASSIIEKVESKPKTKGLMPVVVLLAVLIFALSLYVLHLSKVVNLSFLDSITPKPKVIVEEHTKIETASTKVKIKKEEVKKEEVKKEEVKKEEVKKEEVKKEEVKKEEVKKEEVKKEEVKKEEVKKEEVKKEEKFEVYKITVKEKRAYYKKARLAFKAKNMKEAKKRFLTIAYNYPKDSEAYAVLYQVLKKDKETKKDAVLFIRAYKALKAKKENKTVTKKLIEKLLK